MIYDKKLSVHLFLTRILKEIDMNMKEMFPSNYLSKEDLLTPRLLRINRVAIAEVGKTKERKTIIHFDGAKPLILNKTNAKRLCNMFGDDSDAWRGKTVEAYNDLSVTYTNQQTGEDEHGGVRLRAPSGAEESFGDGSDGFSPAFWTLEQAISECQKNGISRQELIDHMKAGGFKGWDGNRDTATVKALILSKLQPQEESFDSAPASDPGPPDEFAPEDLPPTSFKGSYPENMDADPLQEPKKPRKGRGAA